MLASPTATQFQFDNPALGELYNVLVRKAGRLKQYSGAS